MTNSNKKQKKQKNTKIPVIPFTSKEVYLLSNYQATNELWNRLRVWRASHDHEFIRSLEDLIIKDYAGHNRVLSKQEKELKKAYIDWLVSLESDKFRTLDNIQFSGLLGLGANRKNEERAEEVYHNEDMLTHSGVL